MVYKRLGGDAQDIDDVTTTVYLKIIDRWSTIRTLQPEKKKRLKWLSTTTALVVLEEIRKRSNDRCKTFPERTWEQLTAVLSAPEPADNAIEMKDLYREVWNAVAVLFSGQRAKGDRVRSHRSVHP
ncbi:hypothetical protein [Nonomuraea salmonea]|uniref:hypothetical protein n=1 Tax=Nonomuraea salmonea TaxID=46181 RepID=UPI0031EC46D4